MYNNLSNLDRITKFLMDNGRLDFTNKDYFVEILTESDWINRYDMESLDTAILSLKENEVNYEKDNVDEFLNEYCNDIPTILEGLENYTIKGYKDKDDLLWELIDYTNADEFYFYYLKDYTDIKDAIVDKYLENDTAYYFITEKGHVIEMKEY